MRITALMENTSAAPCCQVEHGLSLYVETQRHRILFDAGQSGLFAQNAERLGIDLRAVDVAVLSHGHFDHAGGMTEFLRINNTAKLYVRPGFSLPHYNPLQKYIGVEPALIGHPRVVPAANRLVLDEELTLVSYDDRPTSQPVQSYGMTEEVDGQRRPDPFHHEQYLLVTEGGRGVLLSGCSHKGICNVMHWAQQENIQALVGGFHFMTVEPEDYGQLDQAARTLLRYPVDYYTCHCTGLPQYRYLKGKMGDRLHYLAAGKTIEL